MESEGLRRGLAAGLVVLIAVENAGGQALVRAAAARPAGSSLALAAPAAALRPAPPARGAAAAPAPTLRLEPARVSGGARRTGASALLRPAFDAASRLARSTGAALARAFDVRDNPFFALQKDAILASARAGGSIDLDLSLPAAEAGQRRLVMTGPGPRSVPVVPRLPSDVPAWPALALPSGPAPASPAAPAAARSPVQKPPPPAAEPPRVGPAMPIAGRVQGLDRPLEPAAPARPRLKPVGFDRSFRDFREADLPDPMSPEQAVPAGGRAAGQTGGAPVNDKRNLRRFVSMMELRGFEAFGTQTAPDPQALLLARGQPGGDTLGQQAGQWVVGKGVRFRINYLRPRAMSRADASGFFYLEPGRLMHNSGEVIPQRYWGEFPLYHRGDMAEYELEIQNTGARTLLNVVIDTAQEVFNPSGKAGKPLPGQTSTLYLDELAPGKTAVLRNSFRVSVDWRTQGSLEQTHIKVKGEVQGKLGRNLSLLDAEAFQAGIVDPPPED